MIAVKAHFDGKVIVLDEPLSLIPDQAILLHIQTLDKPAMPLEQRVFGQQPGAFTYIAEDFNDALPECYWLGEDGAK